MAEDPDPAVRVTPCDTVATITAASGLFDLYRQHYGESAAAAGVVGDWLTAMVGAGMLTVFTAARGGATTPIGLATAHAVPASLALGRFWQLRDLFVVPEARGDGVATALVGAVRAAALAAGATRLSLVTEPDNHAALALYDRLGFRSVDGLTTLSLDLRALTP